MFKVKSDQESVSRRRKRHVEKTHSNKASLAHRHGRQNGTNKEFSKVKAQTLNF